MIVTPSVSIIVPVFNRAKFLERTIQSVLNQSNNSFELLLVDDGSTDDSLKIAKTYQKKDRRVQSISRSRAPKGAPTCRNIGIESAKGDYIIFLDSDDLMASYCLEQRLKRTLEFPEEDFWIFPMLIFRENIDDSRRLTNYASEESDLHRFLRSDIVWTVSCPIWKREVLMGLRGFDENFPNCQDHELHLRALFLGLRYRKFLDDKPDTFYRKHDGETVYDPNKPLKHLIGVNMLLKKVSKEFQKKISEDSRLRQNIFYFLFDSVRKYTRNGEFSKPYELVEKLFEHHTIDPTNRKKLRLYIRLSRNGLNRVRGYERLWDILLKESDYSKTWGKKIYQGDL